MPCREMRPVVHILVVIDGKGPSEDCRCADEEHVELVSGETSYLCLRLGGGLESQDPICEECESQGLEWWVECEPRQGSWSTEKYNARREHCNKLDREAFSFWYMENEANGLTDAATLTYL